MHWRRFLPKNRIKFAKTNPNLEKPEITKSNYKQNPIFKESKILLRKQENK
jgi:hypothetical protein